MMQRFAGISFICKTTRVDIQVWDDDVRVYQVDDKETRETMGYFFVDVHKRDGKKGHAFMRNLQTVIKNLNSCQTSFA